MQTHLVFEPQHSNAVACGRIIDELRNRKKAESTRAGFAIRNTCQHQMEYLPRGIMVAVGDPDFAASKQPATVLLRARGCQDSPNI